ncbi:MAG: signal peptide peptidase SppA [Thiomargarita sp.]|nr:signal peptide peptidase SppA [Thiomargarita sp.]
MLSSAESKKSSNPDWERDVLNRLAFAALNEQRRARRWRTFFFILTFSYLFLISWTFMNLEWGFLDELDGDIITSDKKHTALIEIEGIISTDSEVNADQIVASLRNAYEDKKTAGIIIRINSPGGSPVQSAYINDEITRLKAKHPDIPVYAVVSDICASGGYYIAVAADEIYANESSMVGSIGVLINSFGFVDAIKNLGIERRLFTAGENKGFLDPFSPINDKNVAHIENLLQNVHEQFIATVKAGRKKSLEARGQLELLENQELFSGLIWTGKQAIEIGLIDGIGSSSYVAREIIKVKKIKDFTKRPNYLDRFAERLGVVMAKVLAQQLSSATNNSTMQ